MDNISNCLVKRERGRPVTLRPRPRSRRLRGWRPVSCS